MAIGKTILRISVAEGRRLVEVVIVTAIFWFLIGCSCYWFPIVVAMGSHPGHPQKVFQLLGIIGFQWVRRLRFPITQRFAEVIFLSRNFVSVCKTHGRD